MEDLELPVDETDMGRLGGRLRRDVLRQLLPVADRQRDAGEPLRGEGGDKHALKAKAFLPRER